MKNVLFIVTEIQSANGICCMNIMRFIQSKGINVYCISNKEYGQAQHYMIDNINVFTVKPRLTYSINSFLKQKSTKLFFHKVLHLFGMIINKIELLFSIPTWPLISRRWTKRIYKKAETACKQYNIDTIIAVYTQIDALIAAHQIKYKNPNIKYVAYFLDSLSGGYGPKYFSQHWIIKRGIKWEQRVLTLADNIIMMESAKSHYLKNCKQEKYFKKINFLDIPLFSPKSSYTQPSEHRTNKDIINITYIGSIHKPIRDPQYFLQLFTKLTNSRLRLNIVGPNNCPDILNHYASIDKRISIHSYVPHHEAQELINTADFLLNIGNNNPCMTPSKIFEYISYGKPIISTAPIMDEPCIRYLTSYPLSLIIYELKYSIEHNAQLLEQFIKNNYNNHCDSNYLINTYKLNTPQAFFDAIQQSIHL